MHKCGWCYLWGEVKDAYDEGRKEEAVREFRRIVSHFPESNKCLVFKHVNGKFVNNGENVDGKE